MRVFSRALTGLAVAATAAAAFAAEPGLRAFPGGEELGEAVTKVNRRIAERRAALPAAEGPAEEAELAFEGPSEESMDELGREAGIYNGVDVRGMSEEELDSHPELFIEKSRLVQGEELRAAVERAKVRVDIDLAAQRLTLKQPDEQPQVFKISSAREGYRTPTGCFVVDQTMRMAYSQAYGNSPMPFSVFFKGGTKYATHGTEHVGDLGHPASHGCVRLRTDNAKKVFDAVRKYDPDNTEKNTLICISGRPPQTI